jgi:hypothetical protein
MENLRFSAFENNYDVFNYKPITKRKKKGINIKKTIKYISYIGILLVFLQITYTLTEARFSNYTFDNKKLDPISAVYFYLTFGFDVLDARVLASLNNPNAIDQQCLLSAVFPLYNRLAQLFDLNNSTYCFQERFSVQGMTSTLYYTFLSPNSISKFIVVTFSIGFLWGIFHTFSKKYVLFLLMDIYLSLGMLLCCYTNFVFRGFLFLSLPFYWILFSVFTSYNIYKYKLKKEKLI